MCVGGDGDGLTGWVGTEGFIPYDSRSHRAGVYRCMWGEMGLTGRIGSNRVGKWVFS